MGSVNMNVLKYFHSTSFFYKIKSPNSVRVKATKEDLFLPKKIFL